MDNYEIKKLFATHPRMSDDDIARKFKLTSAHVKAIREGFTAHERLDIIEKIKFNNTSRAYAAGNGAAIVRKD
jgi:hypothetical protein